MDNENPLVLITVPLTTALTHWNSPSLCFSESMLSVYSVSLSLLLLLNQMNFRHILDLLLWVPPLPWWIFSKPLPAVLINHLCHRLIFPEVLRYWYVSVPSLSQTKCIHYRFPLPTIFFYVCCWHHFVFSPRPDPLLFIANSSFFIYSVWPHITPGLYSLCMPLGFFIPFILSRLWL